MDLMKYKGRVISVMLRNVSKPVGGYLDEVADDFIMLSPTTPQMDKIYVSVKDIVSVIINRGNRENERQG